MAATSISGIVASNGDIVSGSGFSATRIGQGEYQIVFDAAFSAAPATVGSQVLYKSEGQDTRDNVVFPFLAKTGFTALTGDSGGNHQDRNFAFISSL